MEAEHLALAAVRAWVGTSGGAHRDEACQNLATLTYIFRIVGNPTAARSFDQFMYLLSTRSRRMIDVRCTACKCLSRDEITLLIAFRAAQHEQLIALETLLSKYLPEEALRTAARALTACFAIWKSTDHLLPDCPGCTAAALQSISRPTTSCLLN